MDMHVQRYVFVWFVTVSAVNVCLFVTVTQRANVQLSYTHLIQMRLLNSDIYTWIMSPPPRIE